MFERFKVVREGLDTTSKLLHLGLRSLGDEGDDTDATGDEVVEVDSSQQFAYATSSGASTMNAYCRGWVE